MQTHNFITWLDHILGRKMSFASSGNLVSWISRFEARGQLTGPQTAGLTELNTKRQQLEVTSRDIYDRRAGGQQSEDTHAQKNIFSIKYEPDRESRSAFITSVRTDRPVDGRVLVLSAPGGETNEPSSKCHQIVVKAEKKTVGKGAFRAARENFYMCFPHYMKQLTGTSDIVTFTYDICTSWWQTAGFCCL